MRNISSILKAQLGLHQTDWTEDPLLESLFEDQSTSAASSDFSSSARKSSALDNLTAPIDEQSGTSTAGVLQSPSSVFGDDVTDVIPVFSFRAADGPSSSLPVPIDDAQAFDRAPDAKFAVSFRATDGQSNRSMGRLMTAHSACFPHPRPPPMARPH